jgi:hypothetical protein
MNLSDLREHYRDTAAVEASYKTPQGALETETFTLSHLPIDEALLEELDALTPAEGAGPPVSVLQLLRAGARIEDLTEGGEPVTVNFDAEFWQTLHPAVRRKCVAAINANIPFEVRRAVILRGALEEKEKADNVEGDGAKT